MDKKKLSKNAYGGVPGKDYVPYINTGSRLGGNTIILIAGILLAILFAASTAYSGMKSGLTVAAGIPGAILGSGIVAAFAKSKGILAKNLLQGMSSGGESVASGMIFVLPAVLLIGAKLSFFEGVAVGVAGVIFGIGVSTIVHEYLIIQEHGSLMYPESMAIAETLVASEGAGKALKFMGIGFGIGGAITLFTGSFLGVFNNVISYVRNVGYRWRLQLEVSPMLLGIGYIVGLNVALLMFAGSILANFAIIPLLGYFAEFAKEGAVVWNNSSVAISTMDVGHLSNSYIRYIGAGMMLSGGVIGAIKLIPTIVSSIKSTLSAKGGETDGERSSFGKFILIAGVVLSFVMAFLISSGNITMAILIGFVSLILAMLFVIVAGRLTGTVGCSNLPVSGMTIASLVLITLLFVVMKWTSAGNNKILLLFGSFIVTAIAMGGGYCQSQKVGFIVGGRRTEMGKYLTVAAVFGVITVVGTILLLAPRLTETSHVEFALPQANLMSTLTRGIMSGQLPWGMIIAGAVMGIFFYLCKLPVMTVSIGFYLPISTTSIILVGALVRLLVEKLSKSEADKDAKISNGTSLSAGLVAGSSIIGLIGIILQVFGVIKVADPKGFLGSNGIAWVLLAILLIAVLAVLSRAGVKRHEGNTNDHDA